MNYRLHTLIEAGISPYTPAPWTWSLCLAKSDSKRWHFIDAYIQKEKWI